MEDQSRVESERLRHQKISQDTLAYKAFWVARHSNPTFGVEHQARVGEPLRDKYTPRERFKKGFVQMYAELLKEFEPTREDYGDFEGQGVIF